MDVMTQLSSNFPLTMRKKKRRGEQFDLRAREAGQQRGVPPIELPSPTFTQHKPSALRARAALQPKKNYRNEYRTDFAAEAICGAVDLTLTVT
jgi:hypothetical protein